METRPKRNKRAERRNQRRTINMKTLYLQTKLNIADMCGLAFTGEIDDDSGEPVFIGTDQQHKMYKEAIERENLE